MRHVFFCLKVCGNFFNSLKIKLQTESLDARQTGNTPW